KPEILRVPSLRNVAVTRPYFHDGSARTLDEAARRMAAAQLDRTLSDQQTSAIVAFLRTLTGTYRGRPVTQAAPCTTRRPWRPSTSWRQRSRPRPRRPTLSAAPTPCCRPRWAVAGCPAPSSAPAAASARARRPSLRLAPPCCVWRWLQPPRSQARSPI